MEIGWVTEEQFSGEGLTPNDTIIVVELSPVEEITVEPTAGLQISLQERYTDGSTRQGNLHLCCDSDGVSGQDRRDEAGGAGLE
jgi:hypothetical protein